MVHYPEDHVLQSSINGRQKHKRGPGQSVGIVYGLSVQCFLDLILYLWINYQ